MDIQQVNREDGEAIRVAFKNVDGGGSVTTGFGICVVTTAASFSAGQNAVKSTAALGRTFWGVAQRDVPINGFGKATVEGYAASIVISNVGTSITVTAGDTLIYGAVAGTFFSAITDQAFSTQYYRYIVNGTTQTVSALAWVSGFVKGF